MCGDVDEGFELAVGPPCPVEGERAEAAEWLAHLDNTEPTPEECAEFERQEKKRDARIHGSPIMEVAHAYAALSHRWLGGHEQSIASADSVLTEAVEIARFDAWLISAKLYRALAGRDRHADDGDDEHPIQNDWNGSAKVALISLERSESAWRTIADATEDQMPGMLADQLRDLRRLVEHAFPDAWSFVRPGFDEPDR